MLNLKVHLKKFVLGKGEQKEEINLTLPTKLDDITPEVLTAIGNRCNLATNHVLVAKVLKAKISTLALAASNKDTKATASITVLFIKSGESDNKFINSLKTCDKLIVSPTDIQLGYHVYLNTGVENNKIMSILEEDTEMTKQQDEILTIDCTIIPANAIKSAVNLKADNTQIFGII